MRSACETYCANCRVIVTTPTWPVTSLTQNEDLNIDLVGTVLPQSTGGSNTKVGSETLLHYGSKAKTVQTLAGLETNATFPEQITCANNSCKQRRAFASLLNTFTANSQVSAVLS